MRLLSFCSCLPHSLMLLLMLMRMLMLMRAPLCTLLSHVLSRQFGVFRRSGVFLACHFCRHCLRSLTLSLCTRFRLLRTSLRSIHIVLLIFSSAAFFLFSFLLNILLFINFRLPYFTFTLHLLILTVNFFAVFTWHNRRLFLGDAKFEKCVCSCETQSVRFAIRKKRKCEMISCKDDCCSWRGWLTWW